jgi:hypothetical protein
MGDMDLPGVPGHDARAVPGEKGHPYGWATFVPMAFADGLGWTRIAVAQAEARAACLSVTAHIHHLMDPQTPLRELDAKAEPAIRALEDGAESVTVIDDLHRVDRAAGP